MPMSCGEDVDSARIPVDTVRRKSRKAVLDVVAKIRVENGTRAPGYVRCPQGPPGGSTPALQYLDARVAFRAREIRHVKNERSTPEQEH
jgi:hypothetical protein